MSKLHVFIDGQCPLCRRALTLVRRWGVDCVVEPLQSVDLRGRGVDPVRARQELAVRSDAGLTVYGYAAWLEILAYGPLGLRVVGRVLARPVVCSAGAAAYQFVARRRGRCEQDCPGLAVT